MKLYSGPLSLFTAKVRIALAEKGDDYERVEVGWTLADRYVPHHPDVVRLNPKREVPILEDGALVVCDSTVILEYLEERFPKPPLYPSGVADRARCRQLEAAADEILFRSVWDVIEESLYPESAAGRDAQRLADAKARFAVHYAATNTRLAGRDFLVDAFSVADIGTFIMLNTAVTLGVAHDPGLSDLAGWLARLAERPAIANELGEMQEFLAESLGGT